MRMYTLTIKLTSSTIVHYHNVFSGVCGGLVNLLSMSGYFVNLVFLHHVLLDERSLVSVRLSNFILILVSGCHRG